MLLLDSMNIALQDCSAPWVTDAPTHQATVLKDHWLRAECTALTWARQAFQIGNEEIDGNHLTELSSHLLPLVFDTGIHQRLASFVEGQAKRATRGEKLRQRAMDQLSGMIHAILATAALRGVKQIEPTTEEFDKSSAATATLNLEFREQARQCIDAYRRAWGQLDQTPWQPRKGSGFQSTQSKSQTDESVDTDQKEVTVGDWWQDAESQLTDLDISNSDYLVLRRLVTYLLGHSELDENKHPLKTVLVDIFDKGHVRDAWIDVSRETLLSAYIDPVSTGLTTFDDNLINSLKWAWKNSCTELQTQISNADDKISTAAVVRVRMPSTELFLLEGDSASGLLSCGILLAAKKKPTWIDPDLTISAAVVDVDGNLGPVGGIKPKIEAFSAAGGRRMVIHPDNWEEAAPIAKKCHVRLLTATALQSALAHSTEASWKYYAIESWCMHTVKNWDRLTSTPPEGNDDDSRLYHYVPHHYSWLKDGCEPSESSALPAKNNQSGEPEKADNHFQPVAAPDDDESAELTKLLLEHRYVCLAEDSGAGKSVFTQRVQAFLSTPEVWHTFFGGRPVLSLRFEAGRSAWPADFAKGGLQQAIATEIAPFVDERNVDELSSWILETGRVCLILDALDQLSNDELIQSLCEFLATNKKNAHPCRVILTGRLKAILESKRLMSAAPWKHGRVDGFSIQQQYELLNRRHPKILPDIEDPTEPDAIRSAFEAHLVSSYDDAADLLQVPVILSLIRELYADRIWRGNQGKLQPFRNRAELYVQVHEKLLTSAWSKNTGTEPPVEKSIRWGQILGAVSYQMMLDKNLGYSVTGKRAVGNLKIKVKKRVSPEITAEDWEEIEQLSLWTRRSTIESAGEDSWGFKHRGMMEFYCGLHLAANSQPEWRRVQTDDDGKEIDLRCGDADLPATIHDREWYWPWRFAAEMTDEQIIGSEPILAASMAELFHHRHDQRRPTELIYRFWHRLEVDLFLLRQLGLRQPQEGSITDEMLLDDGRKRVLPDASLLLSVFRQGHLADGTRVPIDDHPELKEFKNTFCRCPPEGKEIVSWMGGKEIETPYFDEKPRHKVRLPAFELSDAPVTRALFRSFDPSWEIRFLDWSEFPKSDDGPANFVNWYDAFCFAKLLGEHYGLPDECQWEAGCRADTESAYWFGDNSELLSNHAWTGSNAKGPESVRAKEHFNDWGLSDMHGNVWEWTWDWYSEAWYRTQTSNIGDIREEDSGPPRGSSRVCRGGSWADLNPRVLRSGFRNYGRPDDHYGLVGFRVCRRFVACPNRP